MLSIDVSQVINGLVDQLLSERPRGITYEGKHRKSPGLRFSITTRIGSFTEGHTLEAHGKIVFVISGNTSVWYALPSPTRPSHKVIPLDEFINSCNHDSCWRDSGVSTPLTQLYFDLCEKVNMLRAEKGLVHLAPAEMNVFTTFSWLGSPVFERVTVTDAHSTGDDYRRVLLNVEKSE